MLHKDNPELELKLSLDNDKIRFYTPKNIATGYHTSRYVEALNQQIYANAGATRETLQAIMNDMVLRCNKQLEMDSFRTDIAALANNVLYRLKYPVDQHCAIRMGAILCFMEYDVIANETVAVYTEDPNKCELWWLDKKERLAMDIPEAYSFFLLTGIANLPTYKDRSDILNDSDYFLTRDKEIVSLMPKKALTET